MCIGIRVHNSFNVLLLPLNTITGLKEAYRKVDLLNRVYGVCEKRRSDAFHGTGQSSVAGSFYFSESTILTKISVNLVDNAMDRHFGDKVFDSRSGGGIFLASLGIIYHTMLITCHLFVLSELA